MEGTKLVAVSLLFCLSPIASQKAKVKHRYGTGSWGLPGHTGVPGPPGRPGADGFQGPTGITGIKGDPMLGPSGIRGPKGEVGDPGSMTGPKGDKGQKGTKGGIGATGMKGDFGKTGSAGATGATGATGPMGLPGRLYQHLAQSDDRTHVADEPELTTQQLISSSACTAAVAVLLTLPFLAFTIIKYEQKVQEIRCTYK